MEKGKISCTRFSHPKRRASRRPGIAGDNLGGVEQNDISHDQGQRVSGSIRNFPAGENEAEVYGQGTEINGLTPFRKIWQVVETCQIFRALIHFVVPSMMASASSNESAV
jgi:hypothetical protein